MPDTELLRVHGKRGTLADRGPVAGRRPAAVQRLPGLCGRPRLLPGQVRAYAFDLLHFARWLAGEGIGLAAVDTDVLLRYLAANRSERRDGQPENVISLASGPASGFAPATINRRLAAISGLFSFRSMRDPDAVNPVPRGPAARRAARGSGPGCWVTWPGRSRGRSCGSASRGGCPAGWTAPRPPR